ncbi:hypothetical protein KVP70_31300 [Duganella sp. HSC-15S17]|nr:hypothetical protein [Duganella violaceicalia]MBV6325407.1 hypothetical protein [Duganella violaceicalia]
MRLSKAIQQAVVIDATKGAAFAWAYLSSFEVPSATILRVLSGARKRRETDPLPERRVTTE